LLQEYNSVGWCPFGVIAVPLRDYEVHEKKAEFLKLKNKNKENDAPQTLNTA